MKVLWFTNTPCRAIEKLTGKAVLGGGWLYALSEEIVQLSSIELHIAFYWGIETPAFEYKGVVYHPILRRGDTTKFGRLINRIKNAYSDSLDKESLPKLQKIIDEVLPDIIHIHGSEENFGLIVGKPQRSPVVLSIQGLLSPYLCKLYSGFSRYEIIKNEGVKNKFLANGINLQEHSMKRCSKREIDFLRIIPNIIGRTFWDRSCSLAINPNRRYFEVGEILRPEFYNVKWNKNHFPSTISIVSTISNGYYKGVECVFQTAKILKDAGFNFVWNIIGSSCDDNMVVLSERRMKKRADTLSINLLGKKNAQEIIEILCDADIFVQVSHIENSPNSLAEAMLLGMPIIATYAGGTASLLNNNVEGRLVQDGDPYAMAGMILEMSSDFLVAKKMGEHAAEIARLRHSPENVCQQLLAAYDVICN